MFPPPKCIYPTRADDPTRNRQVRPPDRPFPTWAIEVQASNYSRFDALARSDRRFRWPLCGWIRLLVLAGLAIVAEPSRSNGLLASLASQPSTQGGGRAKLPEQAFQPLIGVSTFSRPMVMTVLTTYWVAPIVDARGVVGLCHFKQGTGCTSHSLVFQYGVV